MEASIKSSVDLLLKIKGITTREEIITITVVAEINMVEDSAAAIKEKIRALGKKAAEENTEVVSAAKIEGAKIIITNNSIIKM